MYFGFPCLQEFTLKFTLNFMIKQEVVVYCYFLHFSGLKLGFAELKKSSFSLFRLILGFRFE